MNTEEKLRQQLARYGGGSTKQVEQVEGPEPESNSSFASIFEPLKDWYGYGKVFPLLIKIQPENPPQTEFHVGDWWEDPRGRDSSAGRQAFPEPRWPSPGQPNTHDIDWDYWHEWDLWRRGIDELRMVVWYTIRKLQSPDDFRGSRDEQSLAERWAWLTGVWASRNITPPTTEQLEEWAKQALKESAEQAAKWKAKQNER